MFRSSNSSFDTLLQKATNPAQLELDWDVTLNLCDLVRSGQVKAVYAIEQIQELLSEENPRTVLFALAVVDAVVKNCGKPVHDEVITRAFINEMHNLATRSTNTDVRQRSLEMLQCWAHGFQSKPEYDAVKDMVNLMKLQGCQFPIMTEADAMFDAACAPEWMDGSKCHRCRTEFSILNRKHHCRNCGQIFCHKCSSKQLPLLKYGIEKPVRVCDSCIEELKHGSIKQENSSEGASNAGSDPGGVGSSSSSTLLGQQQRVSRSHSESHSTKRGGSSANQPPSSLQPSLPPELQEYFNSPLAKENQAPQPKTKEDELREREEIELALALSQSEIEAQKQKKHATSAKLPTSQPGSIAALRGNSATKNRRQQQQADDNSSVTNDPYGTLKPVKGILKNSDAGNRPSGLQQQDFGSPTNYPSELDKYLNRSTWENKQMQQMMSIEPSAPSPSVTTDNSSVSSRSTFVREPVNSNAASNHHQNSTYNREFNNSTPKAIMVQEQQQQNGATDLVAGPSNTDGDASASAFGASRAEIEKFISAMDTNIDVFTARIQSDVARNRSITADPTVQTLFQTITARHPDLVAYISQMDENRTQLEGYQDKITRLREAREALEALRADHQDKLRRHAEEQAQQRQQQMFQKLDVLRYKKRELLDEQRRLALQRIHDQEVQLQMKLDSRRYGAVPLQQQQQPMPVGSNINYQQYDAASGIPIDAVQQQQQQSYGNVIPTPYGQPYYTTPSFYGPNGAALTQQPSFGGSDMPSAMPSTSVATNIPAAIQQQLQQQPHPHWTMFPPQQQQQQQPQQQQLQQPAQYSNGGFSGQQQQYYAGPGSQQNLASSSSQPDLTSESAQIGYMQQQLHSHSTNMQSGGYQQNNGAAHATYQQPQLGSDINRPPYQQQAQQQTVSNGIYQSQSNNEANGAAAVPAHVGKLEQQQQQPTAVAPAKPEEGLLISFD